MTYMQGLTERQQVELAVANEDKGVGSTLSLIVDRGVLVKELRRLRQVATEAICVKYCTAAMQNGEQPHECSRILEIPEPVQIGESPVPAPVAEVPMEKAP